MAQNNHDDRNEGKSEKESVLQDRTITGLSYLKVEQEIHQIGFGQFVDKGTTVRIWKVENDDGTQTTIVTNQQKGHRDRGLVVASIHEKEVSKGKIDLDISYKKRPLTKHEHFYITEIALQQLEPHDFDTIAHDVFITEKISS